MKKFKEFKIEKILESERICNGCGKSFIFDYDIDQQDPEDIIHPFEVRFGYWSSHDMEKWKFDLCEKCIEEWVATFKIKIEKLGADPFGEDLLPLDN